MSLQNAAELEARRERDAAADQDRRNRAELADLPGRHGFTMEVFIDVLLDASSKKATGPAPSNEGVNRSAAKNLRNAGFKIDVADVRHIRHLIERYAADALPAALRPKLPDPPASAFAESNVVRFPASER